MCNFNKVAHVCRVPFLTNTSGSPGSATQSRKKNFSTHQTGMVTLVRPR